MMHHEFRVRRTSRLGAFALAAALLAGCDSLLEVDNPNNVKEEDLGDPRSSTAMVNGVEAHIASAWSWVLLDHGAASDELRWVGSRDAYLQMDLGNLTDPNNEFSDATYPVVSRARWWADDAIRRLEAFREEGTLPSEVDLGRGYLYAAFIYALIADHYDDFVISSDRREGGAPVGPDQMVTLYDNALANVDKGLVIARAAGNSGLEAQLLAMRARANFQKGVWGKLNPSGSAPGDPLINSDAALADAEAFLAAVNDDNWVWEFEYSSSAVANNMAAWVNSRAEFRQGDPYITPTANNKDYAGTKITDLIDTDVVSPYTQFLADDFETGELYPTQIAISAREMHLMIAEIALAKGNNALFAEHINHVRALDGLTPWTGEGGQPPALDMLVHMRQTNLYLQGRRLHDHYRFGIPSTDWSPTGEAITHAGTFFPITRIERDANPNIGD